MQTHDRWAPCKEALSPKGWILARLSMAKSMSNNIKSCRSHCSNTLIQKTNKEERSRCQGDIGCWALITGAETWESLGCTAQALEAQTGRSTVSRRLGIQTEQKLKMFSEEMSRFLLQTGFTLITVTSCVQKASKGILDYFSIKLWILIFSS